MTHIVTAGAGLTGLSLGTLLARDGHRVTVLERDPAPPPEQLDALWTDWERRGVNQFRMLHLMLPRWRALMESHLPDVITELEARGGLRMNIVAALPDWISGPTQPGDDAYELVTGRRPVTEAAVAAVAARTDGLEVRRGVVIAGLATEDSASDGPTRVTGVVSADGLTIEADLVVDCCGRRSPLPSWLEEIGAPAPVDERDDSGFMYYGRHFRSSDGTLPELKCGLLSHHPSLSILTLPADNGTWGVGFVVSAGDRELRALRDVAIWERALAQYPMVAHWANGESISDGVAVMAAIEDRHRSLVVGGQPAVTGLVVVGDSWACTNPSLGRGASIGLLHAVLLRDVLADVGTDDPDKLVRSFDERTCAEVEPLYRSTLTFDRHRLAEMEADRREEPYEPADPTWGFTKAMSNGAPFDREVLRAHLAVASLLETPEEALARPGVVERLMTIASDLPQYSTPGPDRRTLLEAIAT